MKIGHKDDTLKTMPHRCVLDDPTGHKTYATELVRQLEVVTIHNPQLALFALGDVLLQISASISTWL